MSEFQSIVEKEIKKRGDTGKLLAKKFSEYKGLSWKEFLLKMPLDLDFITACEMYEELNK